MIDDLFNIIINNSDVIPSEFYKLLEKLDLNYTQDMINTLKLENLQAIKEIIYTLYELYVDNMQNILCKVKREELITLYNVTKTFNPENFIPYYKKAIINDYKS